MNNLTDKLSQTELWSKFKHWYKDNYPSILIEREYNLGAVFIEMPFEFQQGVFIKFLEEYFECQLEILSGEEDERYYSFVTKMDHTQIVFKGISGFETLQELILAAFENYE